MNTDQRNPHLLSRGVTGTLQTTVKPVTAQIDWLQFSIHWPNKLTHFPDDPEYAKDILNSALPPYDELFVTDKELKPIAGYTHGREASIGRLFWHQARQQQMIGILFTGADLSAMLAIPIPHDELLSWVAKTSNNITRLDYAMDTFDPTANPDDILSCWRHRDALTPAINVERFESMFRSASGTIQRASTVYVGSRSSERHMRVYDKGKEQHVDYAWTRVELTVRKARAAVLASAMVAFGIIPAGRTALKAFYKPVELRWWDDMMTGEVVYIDPVRRKETNTDEWLRTVVMPLLYRRCSELIRHRDDGLYDALRAMVSDLTLAHDGIK